jgi:hypothetical protein
MCFLWGTNWIYKSYVEEIRPPLWSSAQSSCLQSGDVLCFLWGTNWIYKSYVEEIRPPLWSSGQRSWMQIQRAGFDSRQCQISRDVVCLERGALIIEYNWGDTWKKNCGFGLQNRDCGRVDPSRWPRGILYPQRLTLPSPTSGGRSVGIVRSWTQAMEFRNLHRICFVLVCSIRPGLYVRLAASSSMQLTVKSTTDCDTEHCGCSCGPPCGILNNQKTKHLLRPWTNE